MKSLRSHIWNPNIKEHIIMSKVIQLFPKKKENKFLSFSKSIFKFSINIYKGLNEYFFGTRDAKLSEVAWFYGGTIIAISFLISILVNVNNVIS